MSEQLHIHPHAHSVETPVALCYEPAQREGSCGKSVAVFDVGIEAFDGEGVDVYTLTLNQSAGYGKPREQEQRCLVGGIGTHVVL